MTNATPNPIPWQLPAATPLAWCLNGVRPLLASFVQPAALRRAYAAARRGRDGAFERRALDGLGIRAERRGHNVPAFRALIVAANHPRGLGDGLALLDLLRAARPDVRVLTNHMLASVPELANRCFFVDPFGGPAAAGRSRSGLRAAYRWLRQEGALVIFPAGEVASRLSPGGHPIDAPWQPTIARLARATGAVVIPAFIEGRNSAAFYRAGRIHERLRTLMLGRELLKQRGSIIKVRFGAPVTFDDAADDDAVAVTARIRDAVEALAVAQASTAHADVETIDPPVDPGRLAEDVAGLAGGPLVSTGELEVYCSAAASLPNVLKEIGRLREVTFRAVGEGTGRSSDLDEFDRSYQHLFLWNRVRREIVGAYRIGQTDAILRAGGPEGLYTRTLFRYDERLLCRLSPALELGRSFVRLEYQRNPSALLLLWKGIGRLVVQSPQYRVLFGPVSISSRYRDSSQRLLVTLLEQNHRDEQLAELVEAINPPQLQPVPRGTRLEIGDVDALIARSEPDGKGIPVLLRQYLRLGARLLGFNVDPAFGDALDALVMVDLTQVDRAILSRYMGRAEAERFLAMHRATAA